MKKLCLILLSTLLFLVGCSSQSNKNNSTDNHKKKVVATTSFVADITHKIAGDSVNIETIIPAGEDPHIYVAKTSDLDKIKKADLVLYHGLHFEGKMIDTLEKLGKEISANFPKERLTTLDEDGEIVTDPHFWFDITLYKKAVETTSSHLQNLVPEQKDIYQKNTEKYLKELDELDVWIKAEIEKIPKESRYLITPHDAFNYFAKNYNIKVEAPQGISTESEVDNKSMIETVNLIVDNKVKAIFTESTTSPERMEKLQEAVKAKGFEVKIVTGEGKELFSDSLAPKGETGDTFIEMYKHNIRLIVSNLA